MTILRYLRRKGIGFAWKAFLGFSVVFITFQLANTIPRRSHKDRQSEDLVFSEQKRSLVEVPEESNNLTPLRNAGSAFVAHIGGKIRDIPVLPVHQETDDAHKALANGPHAEAPGSPWIASRKRENEFYENIIVHFDLKGAPPKIPYFLDLLDTVARAGATGILLEWEDMFPWTGPLEIAKSSDAYSMDDVRSILRKARNLSLDVVPLVQTFGHLEWILKLEQFRRFRENDAYPQVLCLGDPEGVAIVKDALKQVIDVHKEFGINFFHIGADEAFEFGVCTKSREWITSHGTDATKQLLALSHLKNISTYVKQLTTGATVLAWHDMLKDFDTRIIAQLELGNLIEPVIWDYSENIVTMPDASFAQIANNFPIVWASSAFKGANFPTAKYIDIRHYETNNRAWIDTKIAQQEKFMKFHGIIITGWQRYDHMASICEIWPMGTPSMVLNVQIAKMGAGKDHHVARDRAARVLGCRDFHVGGLDLVSNRCTNYTGFLVYSLFQGTAQQTIKYIETELEKNHHIMGWLSPYNMRHNYTQNCKSVVGVEEKKTKFGCSQVIKRIGLVYRFKDILREI
ncbi:Hexosaminidase D [Trichostrongylus colubriformis]|uniref:beta-N-acetylhexosaminidase n=1 Tax=Trichostrongylus colubriformis TaxID=6319 RepID=A0AAN8FRF2_TRICO